MPHQRTTRQSKFRNRNAGKKLVTKNRSRTSRYWDANPDKLWKKHEKTKKDNAEPRNIKKRSTYTRNRRQAEKAGRVKEGDNKHIDHRNGNVGDNSPGNLRVVSAQLNTKLANAKPQTKRQVRRNKKTQ